MAEGDLQEPGAQQEQSSAAVGLQDATADVGHSAPPATSAAAPLREDQIQNAVSFLSHPKVCQNTPDANFLMQISVNLAHSQASGARFHDCHDGFPIRMFLCESPEKFESASSRD